jgi:hypothetical protein
VILFYFVEFGFLSDLNSTLNSVFYGPTGEHDSVELRLRTYYKAYAAIISNPLLLLTGSGYGFYMSQAIGDADPLIESFFIETLLGIGLFGVLLFCWFYFKILIRIKKNHQYLFSNIYKSYFVTWWWLLIFLNIFSGNIFSNEFFGSTFFFLVSFLF